MCAVAAEERSVRAAGLDRALGALSGALAAASNPHQIARNSLGVNRYGGTERAYSDEAFRVWQGLLKSNPDDVETMHHLAIMHHARAMDLEEGKRPEKSNDDWEKAVGYWATLCRSDAFWDRLRKRLEKNSRREDILSHLQEWWPEQVLQVHYDIALAKQGKKRRAKYHVEMVRRASFEEAAKEAVRKRTYERWIAVLDPKVWQNDVLDPDTIRPGAERIAEFLQFEPAYVPALSDLLRLQSRLTQAWVQQLNAASGQSPEWKSLITLICDSAQKWEPYFRQLVDAADTLDSSVRGRLCFWYRLTGQGYRAMDRFGEALPYYKQAIKAAAEEDDLQQCRHEYGETLALEARELATSSDERVEAQAKRKCREAERWQHLSLKARRLLANAYVLIKEYGAAERVCTAGIEEEIDTFDMKTFQEGEEEKAHLAEMRTRARVSRDLDAARSAMDEEDFEEAVELLNQAALHEEEPTTAILYFLRCQAHMALAQAAQARADLNLFQRLVATQDPEEAQEGRQAAVRLSNDVAKLEKDVAMLGGEGVRKRRRAANLFGEEQFEECIRLLRNVLKRAPDKRGARREVGPELSTVLNNRASETVNEVMGDDNMRSVARRDALRKAAGWLDEALELNPSNEGAQGNREALRRMLENMEVGVELERKFGGPEAVRHQQKAVRAYNDGDIETAVDHLRSAVRVSSKPKELEEELASMLTQWAVKEVNDCGGPPSPDVTERARERLSEALALDPGNQRAQENLAILERMGAQRSAARRIEHDVGGARALRLHQQAVEAYQEEDLERAVSLMRQALEASQNPARLKSELSVLLTQWTVKSINDSGGALDIDFVLEACQRLQEATELDPDNEMASKNLEILMEMLGRAGQA